MGARACWRQPGGQECRQARLSFVLVLVSRRCVEVCRDPGRVVAPHREICNSCSQVSLRRLPRVPWPASLLYAGAGVMRVFRDHAHGAPALQARWGGRGPVTDAASHRRGVVPQGFAGWVRTSVTWVVDPRSQLVSRLCLYLLHVQDHAARDRDLGCPDARLPGTEAKLAGQHVHLRGRGIERTKKREGDVCLHNIEKQVRG